MLEEFGLATAFAAADAGCKAGNVRLENFDKNKPANADELPVPLIVIVKFRGQVADVEAALDAYGKIHVQYDGIEENPSVETVMKATEF